MTRKKILALFAAGFLAMLLLTAPASLLGAWLDNVTHGALKLANSNGTVWHGSAIPVFHSPHGELIPLEQINWKVSLLSLFRGKIELLISQGSGQQARAMEIDAGIKGVDLRHISFEMPAEVLAEIHPLLHALHLQGSLQISSEHLAFSGKSLQGAASAKWLSASSTFSNVNPFGSYQINLAGAGAHIAIALITLSGPLMLDGQGDWSFANGLTLEVHAKAAAENQEALAELLNHLGPEISPGTHLIKIGRAI